MYKNKIVKIRMKQVVGQLEPEQDYQEIIEKYTREGWRFVQIFAPPIATSRTYCGCAIFYDVIFEREE